MVRSVTLYKTPKTTAKLSVGPKAARKPAPRSAAKAVTEAVRRRTRQLELPRDADIFLRYRNDDWNMFARDILRCRLDRDQRAILRSVQTSPKTVASSCNARGKDFTAAVCSVSWLYLKPYVDPVTKEFHSCKVIETGPTERQVFSIMLPEIAKIHRNADNFLRSLGHPGLGGEVTRTRVRMPDAAEWFLEGFKATDEDVEAWSGYHSAAVLVVVTEASSFSDLNDEAVEGITTGDSARLYVFNHHKLTGPAHRAVQPNSGWNAFRLSAFDSVNVRAHSMPWIGKKVLIPGQVDWTWVNDKVVTESGNARPGWTVEIGEAEMDPLVYGDFRWRVDGKWRYFRPQNPFRVRVLALPPTEDADTLVPVGWLEAAFARWRAGKREPPPHATVSLGVDVAGRGNNLTVFCPRYGDIVPYFKALTTSGHAPIVSEIRSFLRESGDRAFVDTIGEGAGVYWRCVDGGIDGVVDAKFSHQRNDTDKTGTMSFLNKRAYCYWRIREELDPAMGGELSLPPTPALVDELKHMRYYYSASGKLQVTPKDDIKSLVGRSPDHADALAETFYGGGGACVLGGEDVSPY